MTKQDMSQAGKSKQIRAWGPQGRAPCAPKWSTLALKRFRTATFGPAGLRQKACASCTIVLIVVEATPIVPK